MDSDDPTNSDQEINEIENKIPEPFNQQANISFISNQSYRQLASLKYFNQNNSFFHGPIIPDEVIKDYVKLNQLSKAKAKSHHIDLSVSDDTDDDFENLYQKIQESQIVTQVPQSILSSFQSSPQIEDDSSPEDINKDDDYKPDVNVKIDDQIIPNSQKLPETRKTPVKTKNKKKKPLYYFEKDDDEDDSFDDESDDDDYISSSASKPKITHRKTTRPKKIETPKIPPEENWEENQEEETIKRIIEKKTKEEKKPVEIKPKEVEVKPKEIEVKPKEMPVTNIEQIPPEIMDRYGIVINNIDKFFGSLSNYGYGHFLSVANELGIENQREEISFYSTTAAVILLFRMLPLGMYTKYQNLLLTLSRLITRFDLSMITKTVNKSNSQIKDKPTEPYKIYLKNSTEQSVSDLEPIFVEYYNTISIEDYLDTLEVRCAYDNWLLYIRREGKEEKISFDLLPPSSLSQFDSNIFSSLQNHQQFKTQMKSRLIDFTNLFTYANIIDGLGNRFIVPEWTKPEIDKIKAALLNFGTQKISSIEFLAKTFIITKSFRSIIDFINQTLEQIPQNDNDISEPELNNEDHEEDTIDLNKNVLKEIERNSQLYQMIQIIIDDQDSSRFNRHEIQFMKIVLTYGLTYFDKILGDKRFHVKNPSLMLENLEMFINRIQRI